MQSIISGSLSPKLFVCLTPRLQPKPQRNGSNDKMLLPPRILQTKKANKEEIPEETNIFSTPQWKWV